MRKNRKSATVAGAVLLILIIMIAAAAIRNHLMKNASSDRTKADNGHPLKAVYLEIEDGDGIFVNLTAEYPFTGTIPEGELYDEAGEKITEQDLNSGDVLNIYGNGVMAESYPAQYHGITKIERTEQANQKYIEEYGHYLEELSVEQDPSQRPHLNICYSDGLTSAAAMIPEAFSYTWTYEENGESRTVTTAAPHILQMDPTEVKKLAEPLKMELQFDEKPENIRLLSWDDSLLGQYPDSTDQIPDGTPVEVQENENGNPEFTAQPGCVYLVQGQWKKGTADYGFRVSAE